jgi:mono/diheme cytochrome c family protein
LTDVPEHLLARSRERRAALGLGGGDAGGPVAGAPAAPGEAAAPSGGAVAVPAAAAAPAIVEAPPPRPDPPNVAAYKARPKVPVYVLPLVFVLPVFAFIYYGMLVPKPEPEDPIFVLGRDVYSANCASCHGTTGAGGVGRPLDEVVTTFPDAADHIAWVAEGNEALQPGTPYGVDRVAKQAPYGTMPAFADTLSEEQIAAVVRYEREEFGGEEPPPAGVESAGDQGTTTGGDVGGDSGEEGDAPADTEPE